MGLFSTLFNSKKKFYQRINDLHANREFQTIIKEIELTIDYTDDLQLVCYLAEAYSKESQHSKAIGLLEDVKRMYAKKSLWNYQLALAYFSAEQPGWAIHFFEEAKRIDKQLSVDCDAYLIKANEQLKHPIFKHNFAERVKLFWSDFEKKESEVRKMITQGANSSFIIESISSCLHILGYPFYFEVSLSEKHEIVLTFAGNTHRAFLYPYLLKKMPDHLKEYWSFVIGRKTAQDTNIQMYGISMSNKDVTVQIQEATQDRDLHLILYSDKILPILHDSEPNAYLLIEQILENTLGEIALSCLPSTYSLSSKKIGGISLKDLPQQLQSMGYNTSNRIETITDNYSIYQGMPLAIASNTLQRADIEVGSTRCMEIISEYAQGKAYIVNDFHAFGAVAGYFFYKADAFIGKSDSIVDFRSQIEKQISERVGDVILFIGGATSQEYCYIDFITFDLHKVLEETTTVFKNQKIDSLSFGTFRPIDSVNLI